MAEHEDDRDRETKAAEHAGSGQIGVDDDAPVPRLPRTKGFKLPMSAVVRIALTGAMLAMILVARRPCADSVSSFVTNMDKTGSGSAAVQMPKPGTVDVPVGMGSAADYETLRPDMTEDQIKAAIERAKAKAHAAGDGSNGSNGSGGSGGSAGAAGSAGSGGSDAGPDAAP